MGTLAAVMTGKGTGAIATIALYGPDAAAILTNIFRPKAKSSVSFNKGIVLHGEIHDEHNRVDEVIIGCEGPDYFSIHCHGNPLIAADIMRLLQKYSAEPVTAEKMIAEVSGGTNSIATEAKMVVADAKTLQATKIIMYQMSGGLSQTVTQWLDNSNLEQIKNEAEDILLRSSAVRPLLFGAKIVLAGPPNSGKSTLLNCLAGKQKAIVTELEGTTRDWVSAECVLGRICAEVIDTAGIDEKLFSENEDVEKTSQQNTKELLTDADLILLVIDGSIENNIDVFNKTSAGKNILVVANKNDLPARMSLPGQISISAKFGTGCDELIRRIEETLGVTQFDDKKPVCFTGRQEELLGQITSSQSKEQAASAISELLNGKLRV